MFDLLSLFLSLTQNESKVCIEFFSLSVMHLTKARWRPAILTGQSSSHLIVKRVLIEHSLELIWEQISFSLSEGRLLVFSLLVVEVVGVLGRRLLGFRALNHEVVIVKLVDRCNSCS